VRSPKTSIESICTIDMHTLMADETLLHRDWHTEDAPTASLAGLDQPDKLLDAARGATCEKFG
jgi:hypothetical protein